MTEGRSTSKQKDEKQRGDLVSPSVSMNDRLKRFRGDLLMKRCLLACAAFVTLVRTGFLPAQTTIDAANLPKTARVCTDHCENLKYLGNLTYEGVLDGKTEPVGIYTVKSWGPGGVIVEAKPVKAPPFMHVLVVYTGKIAPDGASLTDTNMEATINSKRVGPRTFTWVWPPTTPAVPETKSKSTEAGMTASVIPTQVAPGPTPVLAPAAVDKAEPPPLTDRAPHPAGQRQVAERLDSNTSEETPKRSKTLISPYPPGNGKGPTKMRICGNIGCENLVWTGHYYEGSSETAGAPKTLYFLRQWKPEQVILLSKSGGNHPVEGSITGALCLSGKAICGGQMTIKGEFGEDEQVSVNLTWEPQRYEATPESPRAALSAHRSFNHPEITIPAGAQESFAALPADIRAILEPANALDEVGPDDALLPCGDPAIKDPFIAMRIGRSALMVQDYKRGFCWLQTSSKLGSARANTLLALATQLGWGTPKDEAAAFKMYLDGRADKDPWNWYFLEQCYLKGIGTPVNKAEGAKIDGFMMTSDLGQSVYWEIGQDDSKKVKDFEKTQLMLHPPLISEEKCEIIHDKRHCATISHIDQDKYDKQLEQIEQQPSN